MNYPFGRVPFANISSLFVALTCFLILPFVFPTGAVCQETDVDLIAKRLGKMVKKEQLTKAQADVMLSALKKMIAKDSDSAPRAAQSEKKWEAFEKPERIGNEDVSPSAKAKLQIQNDIDQLKKLVDAGEMVEKDAHREIEKMENRWVESEQDRKHFAVESAISKLESSYENTREQRIRSSIQLKQMQKAVQKYEDQKKRIMLDLGKLREMIAESESTGSITRNGREITNEQLESLAEATMNRAASLKKKLEKENELIALAEKNVATCSELEAKFSDRLKELKVQQVEKAAKQAADKLQRQQLEVQRRLEAMDRKIENEFERLDNRDR